ncbi:hypothetical protein [Rhizobium esperanzae]|uniref:Uncharacterized protein n=1 Tax=Rhizobium esperanzae TaxID=1967781 RepID=A0A7W6QZ98_9HYPH|nr:hypothetical protein [Rhizobium esperanzae]MBB4233814.1 hypothetical protein [Rhizobium esperanzae]
MQRVRTVSLASAIVIAVTIGHQASYSAEKGDRPKPPASTRSGHILAVPLDATVTPPIFSISWWSRVKPASNIDPPGYLLRETKGNDVEGRQSAE